MSDESGTRQKVLTGVAVVAFLGAVGLAWWNLREDQAVRYSSERLFICAKTGKVYEYKIKEGDRIPYPSPYSDAHTGYQAELCFWAKDANGEWIAKLEPTPVLLKSIFEPDVETTCPDCGHKVVGHNPRPPEELMQAARQAAGQ